MDDAQNPPRPQYGYRFGNAEFDEARFELRVGGLVVELQHKPLQLLALLLASPGQVVTREEIESRLWAGRVTVDNVIANAVSKLRSALGEDSGRLLVTVPRVGYRLLGPVERIAVGRTLASQMALRAGMAVPGREHFELTVLLASSPGGESWLARATAGSSAWSKPSSPLRLAQATRIQALRRRANAASVTKAATIMPNEPGSGTAGSVGTGTGAPEELTSNQMYSWSTMLEMPFDSEPSRV